MDGGLAFPSAVIDPLHSYAMRPDLPESGGGMPPESPLSMPVQDLRRAPASLPLHASLARTVIARFIAYACTLAIAIYGISEMIGIVGFSNMTWLQGVMIFFFAITLTWIGFAAASTLAEDHSFRKVLYRPMRGSTSRGNPDGSATSASSMATT